MELYSCTLPDEGGGTADFFDEDTLPVPPCGEAKNLTLSVSTRSSSDEADEEEDEDYNAADAVPHYLRRSMELKDSETHSPQSRQGAENAEKEFHADDEQELPDSTCATPTLRLELESLVADARAVLERFEIFCATHPTVSGLSKMRTRFVKEVELSTAAANSLEADLQLRHPLDKDEDVAPSSSSSLAAARVSVAVQNGRRLLKCNCVELLELTVSLLEHEPEVVSVLHPINPAVVANSVLRPPAAELPQTPFEVDIISCGGSRWLKVKGTSVRNMTQEVAGFSEKRSFLAVLANTVKAARCTLLPFGLSPLVVVAFYHPPPADMAAALTEIAGVDRIFVYSKIGRKLMPSASSLRSFRHVSLAEYRAALPPLSLPIEFINFDVTALVALTTDTCSGHAGVRLPGFRILDEQSMQELSDPAVIGYIQPVLNKHTWQAASLREICARLRHVCGNPSLRLFAVPCVPGDELVGAGAAPLPSPVEITTDFLEGHEAQQKGPENLLPVPLKNWIVSDVAFGEFKWIIDTIAGEAERARARVLISQIIVVSTRDAVDNNTRSCSTAVASRRANIFSFLEDTGRVALRHRVVFGVGDVLRAVTLSANRAFVQAARDQGVQCCVAFHPSRALTERKRLGIGRSDGPRKPPDSPVLQL
jgi:hypothetical protein